MFCGAEPPPTQADMLVEEANRRLLYQACTGVRRLGPVVLELLWYSVCRCVCEDPGSKEELCELADSLRGGRLLADSLRGGQH